MLLQHWVKNLFIKHSMPLENAYCFLAWRWCAKTNKSLKTHEHWLLYFLFFFFGSGYWTGSLKRYRKTAENQIPMLVGKKCVTQRFWINQIILGRQDKLNKFLSKNPDLWNTLAGRRI